jgi:diguanylate cyclase (GGDEF)-like protein/PAS domain S-box-containing protein
MKTSGWSRRLGAAAASLQTKLVLCFVGLISVVAVAVYIAHEISTRSVSQKTAEQLVGKVSSAITNSADRYAEEASLAIAGVHSAVRATPTFVSDVDSIRRYLLAYTEQSTLAKYVYIAFADGRFIGVERSMGRDEAISARTRLSTDTHLMSQPLAGNGRPVAAPTASSAPYDPRLRPWYQRAATERKAVWTEPYYSASKNVLVVTYAAPVVDELGAQVAIVGIDFTLDSLVAQLSRLKPTPNSAVHLFSADGRHLAGSDGAKLDAIDTAQMSAWLAQKVDKDRVALSHDGGVYKARRHDQSSFNVATFVSIPESELVAGTTKAPLWGALASLLALAIALTVGVRIVQSVVKDLEALATSAHEIVRGTAITRLPTARRDEVGDLARAFHAMRTRVLQDLTSARAPIDELGMMTHPLSKLVSPPGEFPSSDALSHAPRVFRAIDSAGDAFAIVSPSGTLMYANRAFVRVLLAERERVEGTNLRELPGFAEDFAAERETLLDRVMVSVQPIRKTIAVRGSAGSRRFVDFVFSPVVSRGEIIEVAIVARDVTAAVSRNNALYVAAQHDPSTGLMRRDAMLTMLRQRTRSAHDEPFWLIFIDLDGFKACNDEHGHHKGDEVLAALGQMLRTHTRGTDHACRFGGDEFVMVVSDLDEGDVMRLGERLIADIESTGVRIVGGSSQLSGSVGVARFPSDGADPESLLASADKAMYQSKREGGARVVLASSATVVSLRSAVRRGRAA